jgi:predicted DNA-binding protein with PD1-like motif
MKIFTAGNGYLLRLETGETVHESLIRFAGERGLEGGVISAIGAVRDVELGFYHLDRREYERRSEEGDLEVVSLTGNLSRLEGKPFLHAHAVLSRPDCTVVGGHLFRAVVAATLEVTVILADLKLTRRPDPRVSLSLLEKAGD